MGKGNALLAGGVVGLFFEGDTPEDETVLEIYVRDKGAIELGRFLVETEGYKIVKPDEQISLDGDRAELVNDALRAYTDNTDLEQRLVEMRGHESAIDGGRSRIQIFATVWPPVRAILYRYGCTTEMSFISWNKAYSIFPLLTYMQYKCCTRLYSDNLSGT